MAPLLTLHRPQRVGSRWVMGVEFLVQGQPVSVVLHAAGPLGDKLLAWGKREVTRVGEIVLGTNRSSFGSHPAHFSGLLSMLSAVARHAPDLGGDSPVDDAVRTYHAWRDALQTPEAEVAAREIEDTADAADLGDKDAAELLRNVFNVHNARLALDACAGGSGQAQADVRGVQDAAYAGDPDAICAYMFLHATARGAAPLLALLDVDQHADPGQAARFIAGTLTSQSGLRSSKVLWAQMLENAMRVSMQKVHAGPTLVFAPSRPTSFY